MQRYDFEILRGDRVLYRETAVTDLAQTAVWRYVQIIADELESIPGDRIRVTDEAGRIVILVGLTVVRPAG